MAQSMGMSTGMEQTLNPKMIAFYELLQQPGFELEQAIESELQDNPALEVTAERLCPACGAHMMAASCRECGYKITKEDDAAAEAAAEAAREKIQDLAIEASPMEKPVYNGDDDGFDVMARLTATETLGEHLKWQWGMSCAPAHRAIGDQLIGCINDDGYLDTDLETLAEGLDVPLATMEEVLAEIQTLEPAGVGARTLRECLRLQLVCRDKGPDAEVAQLALKLIDDHWQALARHSYEDIARKLKTTVERVQDGADFVRTELSPYPGRQFHPSWHTGSPHGEGRVRPDVEIKKVEGAEGVYLVEVNESRSLGLRVNSVYRQLWDAMRKDSVAYSSKDREHVQTYLTRAREFIDNLNQRRKTLKLIIEAVAVEQGQYLEQGTHALKPLTRLSVAHKLGLHESTVGRAVSGKYAMLPNGEVIGCEIFFDASLSIKEVIKDLLAQENPRKPYSDEQISMELAKRGIEIARRTVTKYREALKIPPAAQRRRYD